MRLNTSLVVALTVATAFASSMPRMAQAQAGGIAVGAMAPSAMTATALDGTAVDLRTFIGKKPVVMEFWATWCPLCRKLEPALAAAKSRYGEQIAFVNVGVPENQTAERQLAYVKDRALQGLFVFDHDSRLVKAYQVPHTSYVVVIDAKGTVVYTGVGGDQDVDAAVRKALPQH